MVESEAQGRLPGIAPVSVVDIGSNSIRLVIYEGMSRSPAMLFNEKVMCGLGKGLAKTGRMDEASVDRALAALHRFKALSVQARASTMFALATAAAREAENGPDFIHRAEMILGQKVRVRYDPQNIGCVYIEEERGARTFTRVFAILGGVFLFVALIVIAVVLLGVAR